MTTYRIMISRDGDGPICYTPDAIEITIPVEAGRHFRLVLPDGWTSTVDTRGRWRVTPVSPNLDQTASYAIVSVPDGATVETGSIHIDLDVRSSFDPARFALPLRNRASELGEINPRPDIFDRTLTMMSDRLKQVLFTGIYSDIVFLRSEGTQRGGMCSGMARWAIARGLGQEPDPPTTEAAIERIQLYHGRQLRDMALLSAVPWFLRGSPKAAYQAVRRDLLREGITDRALDVAVPKLWRLDLAQALVAEGHTVVPYRLRQEGADRASLEVYDPNHPSAIGSNEPQTIHFDLARNRYAYRKLASMDQSNIGIIAVRQTAYSKPGTAFIATLGSIVFAPRRAWRTLVGAYDAARA